MSEYLKYLVILCFGTAGCFSGCGYDDFTNHVPEKTPMLPANIDLRDMGSLYVGQPSRINEDFVIGGYVTANDKSGNFYRTIVIQDPTGAIEIRTGLYTQHSVFPYGRYVAVKAKDLYIGSSDGVIQIGLQPQSDGGYQPDYMQYLAVVNKYVEMSDDYVTVRPIHFSITELNEGICGMLVTCGALYLIRDSEEDALPDTSSETWATPYAGLGTTPQTGYRIFEDIRGEKIAVVTSGYANFAGEKIPASPISITGILMHGKVKGEQMYILKMRDINDIEIHY